MIHLNCLSPDRRVRKKDSQFIQCDRQSVICLRTVDHCGTSLLVVRQHQFSAALLRHSVTSNLAPALERSLFHHIVPLQLARQGKEKETFDNKKQISVCLSSASAHK